MYISKISLNKENCSVQNVIKIVNQGYYKEHQLIWKFFNYENSRKFLFRKNDDNGWPEFIVLSEHIPHQLENEQWLVQTKEFTPEFNEQDKVYLHIRLNPIVEINNKKHCPINHFKKQNPDWKNNFSNQDIINNEIYNWFIKRTEDNKSIGIKPYNKNSFLVSNYIKHTDFKIKTQQKICFNTVDVSGYFVITNSDIFKQKLLSGIGSSKSMGCGLILITKYHPFNS